MNYLERRQHIIEVVDWMIKEDKTIREASKHFNIPSSTLHDRIHLYLSEDGYKNKYLEYDIHSKQNIIRGRIKGGRIAGEMRRKNMKI